MTDKKVFVAGHKGLAGSAIVRELNRKNYADIIVRDRSALDLTIRDAVFDFFAGEKPDWVFLAAAKVGGIYANNAYPVEFLLENLKIQNNVIEAAHHFGSEKLLFLGSSCIYPKFAPQPMKEEYLLSGELEPTNESYAIAKIAGIKLCSAMRRQYGKEFLAVMPTNLFGVNDNYHPENAHALPMLLRRFHETKVRGEKEVVVWGTGTPKREFMLSDDLAEACVFIMEQYTGADIGEFVNIGTGKEISIIELAGLIKDVVGFKGDIVLDPSKPDGMPRKLLDVSRIRNLGWKASYSLKEGLRIAYDDFLANEAAER